MHAHNSSEAKVAIPALNQNLAAPKFKIFLPAADKLSVAKIFGTDLGSQSMIRKITAVLMLAIAVFNTLNLGSGERAHACDSDQSTQSLTHALSAHEEPDNCGTCHHEGNTSHQCHLGHCQNVVAPTSAPLLIKPDSKICDFAPVFGPASTDLSTLDRPPQA